MFYQPRARRTTPRFDPDGKGRHGRVGHGRSINPVILLPLESHGRSRLLSHLAIDEARNEPGIDLFTSVAVVDAILLDYRPLPV